MTRNKYKLTTLCDSRLSIIKTKTKDIQKIQEQTRHMKRDGDILIFDKCGAKRLWHIFEYRNHKQILLGYQDKN